MSTTIRRVNYRLVQKNDFIESFLTFLCNFWNTFCVDNYFSWAMNSGHTAFWFAWSIQCDLLWSRLIEFSFPTHCWKRSNNFGNRESSRDGFFGLSTLPWNEFVKSTSAEIIIRWLWWRCDVSSSYLTNLRLAEVFEDFVKVGFWAAETFQLSVIRCFW